MIRRTVKGLAQAVWGVFLISLAYGLLLDIWETLGRPGGRCPDCRQRYPWKPCAPHQRAPVDLDPDDPREGC